MTTEENSGPTAGGWQPTPQGGEYDAEATAFVQLPPEDAADAPLAAPGHGYVPPLIVPLTPAPGGAPTGSWGAVPQQPPAATGAEQVHWPEPHRGDGRDPGDPGVPGPRMEQGQGQSGGYSTSHWHFGDVGVDTMGGNAMGGHPTAGNAMGGNTVGGNLMGQGATSARTMGPDAMGSGAIGQDTMGADAMGPDAVGSSHTGTGSVTFGSGISGAGSDPGGAGGDASELAGQWTIPVAGGDLSDESGEFSTGQLASAWNGGNPPATLPGGATAPWATQQAPAAARQEPEAATDALSGEADPAAVPGPPDHQRSDAQPDPLSGPATGEAARFPAEQVPASGPEGAEQAAPEPAPDEPPPAPLTSSSDSAEHPANSYVLRVNGADRPVTDAWIGESLLYVLRERLGLAGAKDGCSQGECGACNVQVDGRLVASCLVPAATTAGSEVRTVEGLAVDGELSDVQRALADRGAVQCGFCIPGMAMTVHDLLEGNHAPTELETRQALCGNLCRCSGYRGVLDAVNEVAAERAASADAAAAASAEARVPQQAPPGAGGAQPQHSPDGGMA